ncbi:type I-E CRISPR-associated endoribonuclease Cas2e [Actinophytocola sp.]|uniref:type I-E CRISPR-associated endoribonuclease Cas2e n=1 Tax=Actinophytocola sp. TaxID=1872138 RepID=UPI003D6B26AE
MTVIVFAACPVGLRGHLTRWLLEISPGVFVGKISRRVRERMWDRVTEMVKTGRAIMVYGADNEQGLAFKVHAHDWIPIDYEGINLILRPAEPSRTSRDKGWSTASKRRRFGRPN